MVAHSAGLFDDREILGKDCIFFHGCNNIKGEVFFTQFVCSEHGDFLALDLGGTNFRVLLCRMLNGVCTSLSRNYNVPTEKLYGPAVGVSSFVSYFHDQGCHLTLHRVGT